MSAQKQLQNKPLQNDGGPSGFLPVPLGSPAIAMNDFRQVLDKRLSLLESLQGVVSMRFYDRVLQKLQLEEVKAAELSGASRDKKRNQERYSHVLDPQYFEQRFL